MSRNPVLNILRAVYDTGRSKLDDWMGNDLPVTPPARRRGPRSTEPSPTLAVPQRPAAAPKAKPKPKPRQLALPPPKKPVLDLAVEGAPQIEPTPLLLPAPEAKSSLAIKPKGGDFLPSNISPDYTLSKVFKSPEQVVQDTLNLVTERGVDEGVANWFGKRAGPYLKNELGTEGDRLRAAVMEGKGHIASSRPEQMWSGITGQIYPVDIGQLTLPPHSSDITKNILERRNSDLNRLGAVAQRDWSSVIDPNAENRELLREAAPWLFKQTPTSGKLATDKMYLFGDKLGTNLGLANLIRRTEDLVKPQANLASYIVDEIPQYIPTEVRQRVMEDIGADFAMPPEIGIDPNKLGKMDLPDVSRRVAGFDQWAQDRARRAVNEGLEREYGPDLINPAVQPIGLRSGTDKEWFQIRSPEIDRSGVLPEGYTVSKPEDWMRPAIYDPQGEALGTFEEGRPGSMEAALRMISENKARHDTGRALHAEGAFMRHCVGGYCEPVMEGKTNVFSLRDRKGMPSVTIETNPITKTYGEAADEDPAFADVYNDLFYGMNPHDVPPTLTRDQYMADWIAQNRPDLAERYERVHNTGGKGLQQIKGYLNAAPAKEDLPAVHEFLKSQGPFSFAHTPDHQFGGHKDIRGVGLQLLPDDRFINLDKFNQGRHDYARHYSQDPYLKSGAAGPLGYEDMAVANRLVDPDDLDIGWKGIAPFFDKFTEFARGGLVVKRGHKSGCGCDACGLTVKRRA